MDSFTSFMDFILDPSIILLMVIGLLFITSIISLYLSYKVQKDAEIKYEFITIISHKFSTPLTAINWNLESLVANDSDENRNKNYNNIISSNQSLINLTNTLIELTRDSAKDKEIANNENITVFTFTEEIANTIRNSFNEKKITLNISCAEDNKKLQVNLDKSRLKFIVGALIKNALNYTNENGKVDIDIIKVGGKIEISVTDNGIGIEKVELDEIFTKFHRSPDAWSTNTEGLGIDLYLIKSVIGKLNGKIRVFSEGKGMGAKFTISLPTT